MSTTRHVTHHDMSAHHTARGLGWFSLGLGLAELLMPGPISRLLGIPEQRGLIRACGIREIATGVGLLYSRDPKPWMYGRLGGDALDLAVLGWSSAYGDKPTNALIAAGTVAGVAAIDLKCAADLRAERRPVEEWDYSDRSGFPDAADSMRGLVEPAFGTDRAHPNGYQIPLSETRH
ncbi:transcriptional regulator [Stutzerimonas tarimensis]|uniref:Transcriptional regulator n=1 Tax=Stutzerimonas tarimensis TaxID=1507735 RepID=A0ABV7T7H4_9GAMM